ncbi:MAG: T9SS type A sorting domain-containing protein [Reichenbachiella sp.]|uniref:T9SS type A sorting domain-containing protein n=1 Tax=Reichenbachiella sp. TaxID=2184521 RepID=UPI003299077F
MKNLVLILLAWSLGGLVQAQNVNIPDANMKAALLAHSPVIDTNGDTEIQESEAAAVMSSLSLASKGISDMTGIEAFVNITTLYASGNSIGSIDLSDNTKLTYLYINANSLSTLDLSSNDDISQVYCYSNNISNFTLPADPSNLLILNIGNNPFTGSFDFSSYTTLTYLGLFTGGISTLDVSMMSNLTTLSVGNNSLTSLDVSMLPDLHTLYANNNSLTSLNANNGMQLRSINVENNAGLECISVFDTENPTTNQLDIDEGVSFEEDCDNPTLAFPDHNFAAALLAHSPSIDTDDNGKIGTMEAADFTGTLDVSNKGILSAAGIEAFTGMTGVNVSNNQIITLDLSASASLTSVDVSDNSLTVFKFDNGANTSVTIFDATGNEDLTCLTVDNATYSQSNWTNIPAGAGFSTDCAIDIPNAAFKTKLTTHSPDIDLNDDGEIQVSEAFAFAGDMNVSNSTSITDLIGIEAFVNISYLQAVNNDLQSIDVTQNTKLEELRLFNNADLAEVNMTTLNSLSIAYISGLNLSIVDVTNCPELTRLYTSGSDLAELDLSNNLKLDFLSAGNSGLTSVDLSNNTLLDEVYLHQNNLLSLDLSATTSYSSINITSNSNLTCVRVHDLNYANSNISFDGSTYFSLETCPPAIPDPKLRAALLAHDPVIDTNDDDILQLSERLAFTGTLSLGSKLITDLTGLDSFENITGLEVNNNSISEADVSAFTQLKDLNLQGLFGGGISELDLSANTVLETLELNGSGLTAVDVSSLANLKELNCSYMQLTALDLSNNPELLILDIENNDFSTIDLSTNIKLVELNTRETPLTALNLNQNTLLETLNIQSIPTLLTIDLSANTALKSLTADDGAFTSLDLSQNVALEYVNCGKNDLTSLTFGNSPSLTELLANQTTLENIDLSTLTGLEELKMNEGQLATLDLSQNTQLIEVLVSNHSLTSIDVTNSPNLEVLNANENLLPSIDLSGNPLLEYLDLFENELTELDVSNNPILNSVDFDGNQVVYLDFSQNPLLEYVYASDNENLHGFNIANGANELIEGLELNNNPKLVCVTVDDVIYAESNFTDTDSEVSFSTACGNYETDILTFEFSSQSETASINYEDHTVVIEVVAGTDIGALTPALTVSADASYSPEGEQDFNTTVTYEVTAGDGRIEEWDVTVSEALASPTDIEVSPGVIDENSVPGSLVGDLSSVDESFNDSFVYDLVSGDGDADNSDFEVSGDQLLSVSNFDFETKSSYNIRIQTDDQNGGVYEKAIEITIGDVNEAPTGLQLSNSTIDESNPIGSFIGELSTDDVDLTDTFTYTFKDGNTDNDSFAIEEDQLVTAEVLDFETKTSYTIDLIVTDQGGFTYEESFSISVNDLPASVTAITLDNDNIGENEEAGTLVGSLLTSGEDLSGSFTYALVAGEGDDDNESFALSVDQISTAASFNYELKTSYTIRVSTDDGNGYTLEEELIISINDVSESTDANILTFVLAEETGDAVIDNENHTIAVEVAYGTDVTSLNPAITVSAGANISLSGAQDFTNAVTYTVTAEEPTVAVDWIVTVMEAASNETDILSFELADQTGSAIIDATNHTVSLEVVYGTDVTSLEPTVSLSTGASISPTGAQDFTETVSYTVTAENSSDTQVWLITVSIAPNSATDILEFSMAGQTDPATLDQTNHTIMIEVTSETDITNLTPTITLSDGASISPSGAQDFSSAFTYTVTAEDGTNQDWIVTVTVEVSQVTSVAKPAVKISLYPNPVTHSFTIESDILEEGELQIFNQQGRVVKSQKISNGDHVIVSELPKGMYYVNVLVQEKLTTTKILIH